jgi:hypothetical protein
MIRKVKDGYKVLSEKGKNLGGPYKSKAAAQERLRQVEFFKHHKGWRSLPRAKRFTSRAINVHVPRRHHL